MNAKTYSCPKCGIPLRSSPKGPLGGVREVTTKDINVAKDIMLCPSCGEVSSYSVVTAKVKATFVIVLIVVTCAILGVCIVVRKVTIPLATPTSQLCTNQVLVCKVDNAHPGFVALGFNRKVRVVASDLQKVGFVTVQIVNCLSKDVNLRYEAKDGWDVDIPDSISRGGFGWMSVWRKAGCKGSQCLKDDADVKVADKSGKPLFELYISEE